MANYYASSRSNFFRVKDEHAFKRWAASRDLDVWDSHDKPGHFAIAPNELHDSGSFLARDSETGKPHALARELSAHLAEGSVAILIEAGAEKLRYIVGYAVALDSRGKIITVSLDDIYGRARAEFPTGEIIRAQS